MPKFRFNLKITKSMGIPKHTFAFRFKKENFGIEGILTIPKRKFFLLLNQSQLNYAGRYNTIQYKL